ncbi:MAG: signal recognition particle receptor subunit alpha [Eggerthellaceae bacterium]
MGFFDRISQGLARSRERFTEQMNVLLDRGPDLDEEFWDGLEETLILADIGGPAAFDIVEGLRDTATRKALPDAYAVLDLLNERMASSFAEGGEEISAASPRSLFVESMAGKTTTVESWRRPPRAAAARSGSADTFRAAAIEQSRMGSPRHGDLHARAEATLPRLL